VLRSARCAPFNVCQLTNMRRQANEQLLRLWRSMEGVAVAMWMDKFVKFLSSVDPAGDSGILSVTVCRVLHVRHLRNQAALPPIVQVDHCRRLARLEVLTYHTSLMHLLTTLGTDALDGHYVCVPLDQPRENVCSLRWRNLAVTDAKVGDQCGLVHMLMYAKYVADHTRTPMPPCVDKNIHYRPLKIAYGARTSAYNFNSLQTATLLLLECGIHINILSTPSGVPTSLSSASSATR